MKDHEFVSWLADRMVHVYGESPSVDFVHRARAVASAIESQAATIARYETTAENYELLQAKVDEQAREIERLSLNIAEYNEHERCYQSEIAALKAQQSKAVGDE